MITWITPFQLWNRPPLGFLVWDFFINPSSFQLLELSILFLAGFLQPNAVHWTGTWWASWALLLSQTVCQEWGGGLLTPPLEVPAGGAGGIRGSLIGTDELTR